MAIGNQRGAGRTRRAAALVAAVGALLAAAGGWSPVSAEQAGGTTPEVEEVMGALDAGGAHTCTIAGSTGAAWCWGEAGDGELGNGDTGDQTEPVLVAGGHTFADITAGGRRSVFEEGHTCALDTAGAALCWGEGDRGRLGDGDTSDHNETSPVAVAGEHTFTDISAGDFHTCAIDTAGAAWCWGEGESGRLGDGDTSAHDVATPVAVAGGHTFTDITAGFIHTCAIDTDGAAWCWGASSSGELGDGDPNVHDAGQPVPVFNDHTFTAITAGFQLTCAIDTAGAAWCWGYGNNGQLGDGDLSDHYAAVPFPVAGGHTFTAITAGDFHGCAIDDAAAAWCWGIGGDGVLGNGATDNSAVPVAVAGGHSFTAISAGDEHTCALDTVSAVWCWGVGGSGRLGDGDTGNHSSPVAVTPIGCLDVPPAGAIVGTSGDDALVGTEGNDVIYGLEGDDIIVGGGGNDTLCGGPGADRMSGGDGTDVIDGGPGADRITGGPGDDILTGGSSGPDTITGGAGDDRITTANEAGGDRYHAGLGTNTCTADVDDLNLGGC